MWWCRSPRDAREPPPGSGDGSRDESAGAARSGAELGHLACLEAGGAHAHTHAGAVDHGPHGLDVRVPAARVAARVGHGLAEPRARGADVTRGSHCRLLKNRNLYGCPRPCECSPASRAGAFSGAGDLGPHARAVAKIRATTEVYPTRSPPQKGRCRLLPVHSTTASQGPGTMVPVGSIIARRVCVVRAANRDSTAVPGTG